MEGNRNNMCEVCGSGNGRCGRCGNMCGYGGFHIIRWILAIIIITWVFCIGMRVGELRARLDAYYGNSYGFSHKNMMYGSRGMMFTEALPATFTTDSIKVIKSN